MNKERKPDLDPPSLELEVNNKPCTLDLFDSKDLETFRKILRDDISAPLLICSAPKSVHPLLCVETLKRLTESSACPMVLYLAETERDAKICTESIRFIKPDVETLFFPSLADSIHFDHEVVAHCIAQRMRVLSQLLWSSPTPNRPRILSTTLHNTLRRLPPREYTERSILLLAEKNTLSIEQLTQWLGYHGYKRSAQVTIPGEYAVRGGLIDFFPVGHPTPLRVDFFGDTIDSLRLFDPNTQKTTSYVNTFTLGPLREVTLDPQTLAHFKRESNARNLNSTHYKTLYSRVCSGEHLPRMEALLPLFYPNPESLFDYIEAGALVTTSAISSVQGVYETLLRTSHEKVLRQNAVLNAEQMSSFPVLEDLYLTPEQWQTHTSRFQTFSLDPEIQRTVQDSTEEKTRPIQLNTQLLELPEIPTASLYQRVDSLAPIVSSRYKSGRKVILAAPTEQRRHEIKRQLSKHHIRTTLVNTLDDALDSLNKSEHPLALWPVMQSFGIGEIDVICTADSDYEGVASIAPTEQIQCILEDIQALTKGDLVVHAHHGIGRFEGLKTLRTGINDHDFIQIKYEEGRLFLPIENLDLLTRFGSQDTVVGLDRLGGTQWQKRKTRVRKDLFRLAEQLIQTAAQRAKTEAPILTLDEEAYKEFCQGFPYEETPDQRTTIRTVLHDLTKGQPMNRLVCGDVGFGKTEVALRAAFATVMHGYQVLILVPTTLLATQHFELFSKRFATLPFQLGRLTRLEKPQQQKIIKQQLKSGQIDLVIGTHALLSSSIEVKRLGLIIVDEEQHFGVMQKEHIKLYATQAHQLTLSATPIPRTLQLAMSGVQDLSIMATPPRQRIRVETIVIEHDPTTVSHLLLNEHERGGQSFYVAPYIEDLEHLKVFLDRELSQLKIAVAHGKLSGSEMDDIVLRFRNKEYDVLLSTSIIESGIDIANANTIIVHRASHFGLAQLYQLRGRVGRSLKQGYAVFTVPNFESLSKKTRKRLNVLKQLSGFGAGFQVASYDLDLRGAGNILGDSQSGHINEVGFELYQTMLRDAIQALHHGEHEPTEDLWSPMINLGIPLTIPESYVKEESIRLALYKRLIRMTRTQEISAFLDELKDRFGPVPHAIHNIIECVHIKNLCLKSHVEKIDVGEHGIVVMFKDNRFPAAEALISCIHKRNDLSVTRDMRVLYRCTMHTLDARVKYAKALLNLLISLINT